ncbi:restriction endonuclease subunit S [Streptomyces sp. NPDC019990]|uniref:restriction endonuclease subunit S n=1 Tax=Streptomyces sp. NPDC019990 TaxID=3154693 RepID=UPI0033E6EDE2
MLLARANGSKRLVGAGVVVPADSRARLIFPDLMYRLIPDPRVLNPRYLGVVIAAPVFRRQVESAMRSTSGQFKISKADLADFVIPVPALAEQRRVVEVLDALGEQERAIEAAISKLQTLRRGALMSLMPFVATAEPGEGFVRGPLKDFVPVVEYGVSAALNSEPSGVPVLRMNNILNGRVVVDDLRYLPGVVPTQLRLRHGDVLFNRTNSIDHVGKSALWREELPEATFASYLVRLTPDRDKLLPGYLVEWLQHPRVRQRVRAIATVAVQQVNVNPTRLRELEIDVPEDLRLQRSVVDTLAAFDTRIEEQHREQRKLRRVKAGLVDDLLQGSLVS